MSDEQPICVRTMKAVGKVETIDEVQRLWGQGCETGD